LRTLYFDNGLELVAGGPILDMLGGVSCLEIAEAKLSVDVEAPCEEISLIGESCHVAKASSALDKVPTFLRVKLDFLRKLDESLVLHTELAKAGLSPAPDVAVLGDSKTEERTACDVADRRTVEGLDIVRG